MKALFILLVLCFACSAARAQTILGKSPADKALPAFFTHNGNADAWIDGLNNNATHGLSGLLIQDNSINSNKLDAATRAMLGVGGSGGSGEANTGANIGTGVGVFSGKSGVQLQFNQLAASGGATVVSNNNILTISADAPGAAAAAAAAATNAITAATNAMSAAGSPLLAFHGTNELAVMPAPPPAGQQYVILENSNSTLGTISLTGLDGSQKVNTNNGTSFNQLLDNAKLTNDLNFIGGGTTNGKGAFITNWFGGSPAFGSLDFYNWDGSIGGVGAYVLSLRLDNDSLQVGHDMDSINGAHDILDFNLVRVNKLQVPGGYVGNPDSGADPFDLNTDGSARFANGAVTIDLSGSIIAGTNAGGQITIGGLVDARNNVRDGLLIQNTTASTSGQPKQNSMALHYYGTGRMTGSSVSQPLEFRTHMGANSGSSVARGYLQTEYQVNSSGWTLVQEIGPDTYGGLQFYLATPPNLLIGAATGSTVSNNIESAGDLNIQGNYGPNANGNVFIGHAGGTNTLNGVTAGNGALQVTGAVTDTNILSGFSWMPTNTANASFPNGLSSFGVPVLIGTSNLDATKLIGVIPHGSLPAFALTNKWAGSVEFDGNTTNAGTFWNHGNLTNDATVYVANPTGTNTFGGYNYMQSNSAPSLMISSAGVHTIAMNQPFTNDLGSVASVYVALTLTNGIAAWPSIALTNTTSGECYTNQYRTLSAGTNVILIVFPDISMGDKCSISNYGPGGSAVVIKGWWKTQR